MENQSPAPAGEKADGSFRRVNSIGVYTAGLFCRDLTGPVYPPELNADSFPLGLIWVAFSIPGELALAIPVYGSLHSLGVQILFLCEIVETCRVIPFALLDFAPA